MNKQLFTILIILVTLTAFILLNLPNTTELTVNCPTPESFAVDFNNFSTKLLEANPGYAEKEQRYYWQKHLEELGCSDESKDLINQAICGDCD